MVPWAVQLPINAINMARHFLHVVTYCTKLSKELTNVERDICFKKSRIPLFTVISAIHVAILRVTSEEIQFPARETYVVYGYTLD